MIAFHVYHYFYHGWKANPDAAAIGFIVEGHTGVGLFFTLSGFLFMLIGMNGDINYKTFLYNRVLRIAPLFIVVFYLAISLGRNDFSAGDIGYLLFSNIGTPPTSDFFITGAAWTISVEFTFYLIFPFLCRFFLESGYRYLLGLLAAPEISRAAAQLPLAFARDEQGRVSLCLLTGLREGINHCIDADHQWQAGYTPAWLRSYPFRLLTPPKEQGTTDQRCCALTLTALGLATPGKRFLTARR